MNALLGSVSTLVAVPLTWTLARRSQAEAEVAGERAELQVQLDAMLHAVMDLQNAARINQLLWDRPTERAHRVVLGCVALLSGQARAHRDGGRGWVQAAGGLAEVVRFLGPDRRAAKAAVAALEVPMSRVTAAAVPLSRSANARLAAATDALLAATGDIDNAAGLDSALREFGEAGRAALAVLDQAPSWWGRLRARRRPSTGA